MNKAVERSQAGAAATAEATAAAGRNQDDGGNEDGAYRTDNSDYRAEVLGWNETLMAKDITSASICGLQLAFPDFTNYTTTDNFSVSLNFDKLYTIAPFVLVAAVTVAIVLGVLGIIALAVKTK
ncbi:uncharacterized protein [Cherax quadricarinatus]